MTGWCGWVTGVGSVGRANVSFFLLFFWTVLAPRSSAVPLKFLVCVHKASCWDLDRNCVRLLYRFGEDLHRYYVETFNP